MKVYDQFRQHSEGEIKGGKIPTRCKIEPFIPYFMIDERKNPVPQVMRVRDMTRRTIVPILPTPQSRA